MQEVTKADVICLSFLTTTNLSTTERSPVCCRLTACGRLHLYVRASSAGHDLTACILKLLLLSHPPSLHTTSRAPALSIACGKRAFRKHIPRRASGKGDLRKMAGFRALLTYREHLLQAVIMHAKEVVLSHDMPGPHAQRINISPCTHLPHPTAQPCTQACRAVATLPIPSLQKQ